jgi:hypothetical protein
MRNDPEFYQASGTIGGFFIGSDSIVDIGNTMGITSFLSSADDVRFWAGESFENRASAPFRVTRGGALASTSGVIGGFTIGSTNLSNGTGNDYILLATTSPRVVMGDFATGGGARGTINKNGLTFESDTNVLKAYLGEDGITPSFDSGLLELYNSTGTLKISLFGTNGNAEFAGTIKTTAGVTWNLGAANSVSPTAPDRTLTVVVGGTTYYIHAKTTND